MSWSGYGPVVNNVPLELEQLGDAPTHFRATLRWTEPGPQGDTIIDIEPRVFVVASEDPADLQAARDEIIAWAEPIKDAEVARLTTSFTRSGQIRDALNQ